MILHTGIALGATLVVLAGALAVLQYREKVCRRSFFRSIWRNVSLISRSKMIVNVKCKPKRFITMLYDLYLVFFFLASNSTQLSGQISFLFLICWCLISSLCSILSNVFSFYVTYRTSGNVLFITNIFLSVEEKKSFVLFHSPIESTKDNHFFRMKYS